MGAIPDYDHDLPAGALALDQPHEAKIFRDGRGVPTIVGATAADIFALHGFAVGQDRLWQIHSQRMAASGRMAEIKASVVHLDVFMRQIGFLRLGSDDWEALQDVETRTMVERFVHGVNCAAAQRQHHGEMFLLTGSRWEPLTPQQLCATLRLVAFGMASGWQHVLVRQWMHDTFGEAAEEWTNTAESADTASPSTPPLTIDPVMSAAFAAVPKADLAWAHGPADLPKGQGSNWFVVGGEWTASGKPMLAGDPHLRVTLPGFWYEVTYCGAINASGMTQAGLPGVIAGHNGACAWSVTLPGGILVSCNHTLVDYDVYPHYLGQVSPRPPPALPRTARGTLM